MVSEKARLEFMCLIIPCMSLLVFPLFIGFAARQETGRCTVQDEAGGWVNELLKQSVPPMWSTSLCSIGLSPSFN